MVELFISAVIALWLTDIIVSSKRWRIYRTVSGRTIPIAGWLVALLVSVAVSALSYAIMPKPKQAKPPAAQEMDSPVAEAGKPVALVMGQYTCKELNVLWSGDKTIRSYDVSVS